METVKAFSLTKLATNEQFLLSRMIHVDKIIEIPNKSHLQLKYIPQVYSAVIKFCMKNTYFLLEKA